MIDRETETLVLLKDAGKHVPGPNKPNRGTVWRWCLNGLRGVKLETIILGRYRYTSLEALKRFFDAQNAPKNPPPALTPNQRKRQAEAANRALEAAGF